MDTFQESITPLTDHYINDIFEVYCLLVRVKEGCSPFDLKAAVMLNEGG